MTNTILEELEKDVKEHKWSLEECLRVIDTFKLPIDKTQYCLAYFVYEDDRNGGNCGTFIARTDFGHNDQYVSGGFVRFVNSLDNNSLLNFRGIDSDLYKNKSHFFKSIDKDLQIFLLIKSTSDFYRENCLDLNVINSSFNKYRDMLNEAMRFRYLNCIRQCSRCLVQEHIDDFVKKNLICVALKNSVE